MWISFLHGFDRTIVGGRAHAHIFSLSFIRLSSVRSTLAWLYALAHTGQHTSNPENLFILQLPNSFILQMFSSITFYFMLFWLLSLAPALIRRQLPCGNRLFVILFRFLFLFSFWSLSLLLPDVVVLLLVVVAFFFIPLHFICFSTFVLFIALQFCTYGNDTKTRKCWIKKKNYSRWK